MRELRSIECNRWEGKEHGTLSDEMRSQTDRFPSGGGACQKSRQALSWPYDGKNTSRPPGTLRAKLTGVKKVVACDKSM